MIRTLHSASVTASIICEVGQLYPGPWSGYQGCCMQPRRGKRGSSRL